MMDLPLSERLTSYAHNEEMVEQGFTEVGKLLLEAAAEVERLREALRWLPCLLGERASGPHCANLPEGREKCPTCRARAALRGEE